MSVGNQIVYPNEIPAGRFRHVGPTDEFPSGRPGWYQLVLPDNRLAIQTPTGLSDHPDPHNGQDSHFYIESIPILDAKGVQVGVVRRAWAHSAVWIPGDMVQGGGRHLNGVWSSYAIPPFYEVEA